MTQIGFDWHNCPWSYNIIAWFTELQRTKLYLHLIRETLLVHWYLDQLYVNCLIPSVKHFNTWHISDYTGHPQDDSTCLCFTVESSLFPWSSYWYTIWPFLGQLRSTLTAGCKRVIHPSCLMLLWPVRNSWVLVLKCHTICLVKCAQFQLFCCECQNVQLFCREANKTWHVA